jgi:hypothetical protein
MKKKDVLFSMIASVEAFVLLLIVVYIKSNLIVVFFLMLFFSSFISVLFFAKESLEILLFFSMFSPFLAVLWSLLSYNGDVNLDKICFYFLAEPIVCVTSWIIAIKDRFVKKTELNLRFPF